MLTPLQKYLNRVRVIQNQIKACKDKGSSDLVAWEWLLYVITTLGNNGMSDDESDAEDGSYIYCFRTKKMPWRRDITKELRVIDSQLLENRKIDRNARTIPRKRGASAPTSTRDPVHYLPRAFYDDQWYNSLPEHQQEIICAVADAHPWIHVV